MPNDLKTEITEIMLKLGMPPKHSGFIYLKEAVFLCYQKCNSVEKISTEIYPQIAQIFNVSVTVVERNIRVLISESHKNGGLLEFNDFYGSVIFDNSFILSNSEVVALIVEILRLKAIREKLNHMSA